VNIPFLNIPSFYQENKAEIDSLFSEILSGGRYILGPQVKEFETDFAKYHNVPFSLGVASGTDALLLALRASGIGAGDEVVVPAFTFISTASTVAYAGAKPVFADIDTATFNLTEKTVRAALTKRTRAVIAVHLYGNPVELNPLLKLCKEKKLILIEDVAQAAGAEYAGRKLGTFGKAGCFSFYPTKNLGAAGDGGMVITSDKRCHARLVQLRDHGQSSKYRFETLGYNSRLDELQAGLLKLKLKQLDNWVVSRRKSAETYTCLLSGLDAVRCPTSLPEAKHAYNLYTIRAAKRDKLREFLLAKGIGCAVHYPRPLHIQKAFKEIGIKAGKLPVAEKACKEVLSLPLYPGIPANHLEIVAAAVHEFYTGKK
jgi:dTDP-4-amino-4,6-dideoxygalactose transaminase